MRDAADVGWMSKTEKNDVLSPKDKSGEGREIWTTIDPTLKFLLAFMTLGESQLAHPPSFSLLHFLVLV